MTFHLRPYQQEAIDAIMEGLRKTRKGLLTIPTGGGKNCIAAHVIDCYRRANQRCLFLADRNELITQPLESLNDFCGIQAGVEKAELRCCPEDKVVVGSIQTMVRRFKNFRPDEWDLIVCDEAHLSMAESWQKVLTHFESAKVLGMSATPFRSDGLELRSFYEAEFYRKTLQDLQDESWLVPLMIEELEEEIDVSDLKVKRGVDGKQFDEQDLAERLEPHLERIAAELLKKCRDYKILAFLPMIYISQRFVQICNKAGLWSVHIDGNDPERVRKVADFKAGKISLLSNASLLHTGFDAPPCSATLNLTPTFSTVRYQQIVGRSTRVNPGQIIADPGMNAADRALAINLSDKPHSLIIDPMFMFGSHGLMIPESLSANNAEEAEQMKVYRRKTKKRDLHTINLEWVAKKEAEMLARLRLEKMREEGVMSVREFAISTGNHFLADFEPIYAKEAQPLGDLDRRMLRDRGIDPDSCSCRGEVDLVCRAINIRRARGLADIPWVIRLIAAGAPHPWDMSRAAASRFLVRYRPKSNV